MLSERDAIETAKESGRKEGMEEGMQKGLSSFLLTVLGKFGPIPVSLEQRISAQTDAETLNR